MGRSDRTTGDPAAGPARAVLLGALALALCLLGWRAVETFTAPVPAATPGPASTTNTLALLETVTGPGRVKLARLNSQQDARSFLVMVDAEVPADIDTARIETILAASAGFDKKAGDTLTVDVFPFAPGVSARPDRPALIEIGGLAVLSALLAGLLAMPRGPSRPDIRDLDDAAPAQRPATRLRAIAPDRLGELDLLSADDSPAVRQAGDVAASNPAAAANVLRRWMRTGSDAA